MPQLRTPSGKCWPGPSGGEVVGQRASPQMDTGGDTEEGGHMAAQTIFCGTVCRGLRPEWCCLIPVAVLWLVVQEEAPLHPSLDLTEVRGRLLLAVGLCLAVGLVLLALRFSSPRAKPQEYQGEVVSSTHSNMVMAIQSNRNTQTCFSKPSEGAVGCQTPAVQVNLHCPIPVQDLPDCPIPVQDLPDCPTPAVQALVDCVVLSLLHEPQQTTVPFNVLPLISRLQTLSTAVQRAEGLWDTALQERQGQQENPEEARDRIKYINTYLKERAEALHSLQQFQTEFEACVRDTQGQLQRHWSQLEELHVRVTLSPKHPSGLPHSSDVLRDTQHLFSELDQSKSSVNQCQTCLDANSKILKELEHGWLELRKTLSSDLLTSCWTADLLQSNNNKFNDVLQSVTSLEQQTSTFEIHLKGLEKALSFEKNKLTRSHSIGALPANGSAQDSTPQSSIAEEKSFKSLFRVKSTGFRGLKRKKKL